MTQALLALWRKLGLNKSVQLRILRFFNDEFLIGVTGVIFNEKNEVLLFKHTYRDVEWSLPGGFLKRGEHPKRGLEREIREESGFKVKVLKIIQATEDKNTARLDLSYYGKFLDGAFKASDEVIEFSFFPVKKLPKLIEDQYAQIEEGYRRYTAVQNRNAFKSLLQNIFQRNKE